MFIFGFKIIFVFLFHIHIWSQKYYRVTCAVPWIDSLVSQEDEKEFSRLISLISLTIFSSSKGSETVQTVQISFQKPSSFNQPLYMKKKGKVKLFKQITFSFEFCRFSFWCWISAADTFGPNLGFVVSRVRLQQPHKSSKPGAYDFFLFCFLIIFRYTRLGRTCSNRHFINLGIAKIGFY